MNFQSVIEVGWQKRLISCDGGCMREEKYRLTPKGIAVLAMMQTGLLEDMDDPRIEGFWTIFEAIMTRSGYVEERHEV